MWEWGVLDWILLGAVLLLAAVIYVVFDVIRCLAPLAEIGAGIIKLLIDRAK